MATQMPGLQQMARSGSLNPQAMQQMVSQRLAQNPNTANLPTQLGQGSLSQQAMFQQYDPSKPQLTGLGKSTDSVKVLPYQSITQQLHHSSALPSSGYDGEPSVGYDTNLDEKSYQNALAMLKNPAADRFISTGYDGEGTWVSGADDAANAQRIVERYEANQKKYDDYARVAGISPEQARTMKLDDLQKAVSAGRTKDLETNNQLYRQLTDMEKQYGIDYSGQKGSMSPELQREYMTGVLDSYGIKDLSQLGSTQVGDKTVFYDRATGQALPEILGGTRDYAKGLTDIKLVAGPGGTAVPTGSFKYKDSKTFTTKILPAMLAMFAPVALPALAAATGAGAMGAGAIYGAGSGALTSAANKGNILKGALTGGATGAVGGAIGSGAGQYNPASGIANKTLQAGALGAVRGGATGLVGSALSGGNIGQGVLGGSLAGGVGGLSSQSLTNAGVNPKIAGVVGGTLGSTARNMAMQAMQPTGGLRTATSGTQSTSAAQRAPYDLSSLPEHVKQRLRAVGVA